jgi:hypothetical protein
MIGGLSARHDKLAGDCLGAGQIVGATLTSIKVILVA